MLRIQEVYYTLTNRSVRRNMIYQRRNRQKPLDTCIVYLLHNAPNLYNGPADIYNSMDVRRKASFSRCQQYRYQLSRQWDEGHGRCVFIGLNPSTADVSADDPTIRRCMSFAQDWGYQEMIMVNLFAYRTPHPALLKAATTPAGTYNRRALHRACQSAQRIVAAWGNHGTFQNQAVKMASVWSELPVYCFGLTKTGQPLHPLYQKRDAKLVTYNKEVGVL